MSTPRFYSRIANAVGPLIGPSADLSSFLSETSVCLQAENELEDHPEHRAGFILATNLCARLYPRIHIQAPKVIVDECAALARQINPDCEIDTTNRHCHGMLAWGCRSSVDTAVIISPAGWNIFVDTPGTERLQSTNVLSALAAGALAVGELFRTVFARFLDSGRVGRSPGRLNILTLDGSESLPELPSNIPLGRVHLAGAGAVGEAAVYALARLPVSGTLVVVDPEVITVSNLQRYVLALDADIGVSKCQLVARALQRHRLKVVGIETQWGANEQKMGEVECVCAALDTAADRIGVQAGLPKTIYNAWTQPADIGWSRHENFGEKPCLACMYMPSGPRPSQHELISRALGLHDLRVLAYLTLKLPVDAKLKPEQIPRLPNYPVPQEASTWVEHSLLEDIGQHLGIASDDLITWRGKQISDMYSEGICGGAIITDKIGELPQDVAVPLAHQSALAGIMLAAQLVIGKCPELCPFRSAFSEARLDVLRGLSQVIGRPRQLSVGCLCRDPDYIDRYVQKWLRT